MEQRRFSTVVPGILLASLCLLFSAAVAQPQNSVPWRLDDQGNLTIHTSNVTAEPVFIPLQSKGTRMELLALRAKDGTVRVAFNTCQACSGSPRAWFGVEKGGVVCQNCGNFFPAEQVGASAHGCNPLAVPGVQPTATGDITIPAAVLAAHASAFRNWKREMP
ncbi:MAG: DUF2318 domain-containing protein [Desulfovibrio sp.]|nr:DUF2318 domain-containing protein [Desulfovibrio sp.]